NVRSVREIVSIHSFSIPIEISNVRFFPLMPGSVRSPKWSSGEFWSLMLRWFGEGQAGTGLTRRWSQRPQPSCLPSRLGEVLILWLHVEASVSGRGSAFTLALRRRSSFQVLSFLFLDRGVLSGAISFSQIWAMCGQSEKLGRSI